MLDWLSRKRFYFRFSRSEVHALCLQTEQEFRDAAVVALQVEGPRRRVLAIGREARSLHAPGVVVVHPFQHERLVLGDVEVAEAVVRYALLKIAPTILRRPDIIMNPLHDLAGGLSDIEKRALHNIALSAGASRTAVYEGAELTREQALQYPVIPEPEPR